MTQSNIPTIVGATAPVALALVYFFHRDLALFAHSLYVFTFITHPDATVAGVVGAFFVEYMHHQRKKSASKPPTT